MTVMHDAGLIDWAESGGVDPFKKENAQPSSLDLRMGPYVQYPRSRINRQFRRLSNWWYGRTFESYKKLEMDLRWHPPKEVEKLTVRRGDFFLLWTLERTEIPAGRSASLLLKSTYARFGLEHLHAGWGDEGFNGHWVLEVTNFHPQPITIRPGEEIVQLMLHKMDNSADKDYVAKEGQYVNQSPVK